MGERHALGLSKKFNILHNPITFLFQPGVNSQKNDELNKLFLVLNVLHSSMPEVIVVLSGET